MTRILDSRRLHGASRQRRDAPLREVPTGPRMDFSTRKGPSVRPVSRAHANRAWGRSMAFGCVRVGNESAVGNSRLSVSAFENRRPPFREVA